MKPVLILGAILIALTVGGFLLAFSPDSGQAAASAAATCPHSQDIEGMREHMDAVHGPGSFDAMHPEGAQDMTPGMMDSTGDTTGQGTGTMQGHHTGGGMMGSGMMR